MPVIVAKIGNHAAQTPVSKSSLAFRTGFEIADENWKTRIFTGAVSPLRQPGILHQTLRSSRRSA